MLALNEGWVYTHRYSLDCHSPFAFHVLRGKLRTLDFAFPLLFYSFFLTKKFNFSEKKDELVCLEELLHTSRFKWKRTGGGERKKEEEGGVGSDYYCRSVFVPNCGVRATQFMKWDWYLYVLWLNGRSWEDFYHTRGQYTLTVTALWIYHCNWIYDWKIKHVEQSIRIVPFYCHQYQQKQYA